jgi:hypothetical protein
MKWVPVKDIDTFPMGKVDRQIVQLALEILESN